MIQRLFILVLILTFLSGCSHRLANNWNVTRYEVHKPNNQKVAVTDLGTISFNNKNTGAKNLQFSIFNYRYDDNSSFAWDDSKDFIVIRSENSQIARTWQKVRDRKNYQRWESIEEQSGDKHVIELKK